MNSVRSSRLFSQSFIERSAGEAMIVRAPRALGPYSPRLR